MNDLFTVSTYRNEGERPVELWTMAQRLATGKLRIPPFQRDYVWATESGKERGWARDVPIRKPVGIIVTYQTNDSPHESLADGLQRLTATLRIAERPSLYGCSFGTEQWIEYCTKFEITVQHRIYADDSAALIAFQQLNQGTSATPMEYHKGILLLSPNGSRVYSEVPQILSRYETGVRVVTSTERRKVHTAVRDALSLFLQYASETDMLSFWNAGMRKIDSDAVAVERVLSEWLRARDRDEVEATIKAFERFIAGQAEILRTHIDRLPPKPMQQALFRWFMHLGIYRRNANLSVNEHTKLVGSMLSYLSGYDSYRCQFSLPNTDPPMPVGLHQSDLNQLATICTGFGSALYTPARRKRRLTIPGLDNSHLVPFSMAGEGPTIYEPSSINRARGSCVMSSPL